jgi:hypothetical protein
MSPQVMSLQVSGRPIEIRFAPSLRAHRGKLFSGKTGRAKEVHAGSFLRRRRIVLDAALKRRPSELSRILTHELFHFAWLRLGNPKRRSYEALLRREMRVQAPGELGWSAEHLKIALDPVDCARRTRRWREYVCESFCDTGAALFSGARRHDEFTLPAGARRDRRVWFRNLGIILL